jgi:hypothetical protein
MHVRFVEVSPLFLLLVKSFDVLEIVFVAVDVLKISHF